MVQTRSLPEKRRAERHLIRMPVAIQHADWVIRGQSRDISDSGVLIEAPARMPILGSPCQVTLDSRLGDVQAHGRVARIDANGRSFAVELTRFVRNGPLLLSALLSAGG